MTETFYANEGWSLFLYLLFATVGLGIAVVLPYAAIRKGRNLSVRTWKDLNYHTSGKAIYIVAILAVVEVFCVFGGLNCVLSLTIPNKDSITISDKAITIHKSAEYGFFFNKKPAKDTVIPLENVVSVSMTADCYGIGESVSSAAVRGYKDLRIVYTLPDDRNMQEEYIMLTYYSGDDQFKIHRCMKKHFPNYAAEEGNLDVFKRL